MQQADIPLTREQRADIVTARETIKRAVAGEIDVDLPAVVVILDRVLESVCPHGPEGRYRTVDPLGGELIICPECGVSWHAENV